MVNAKKGAGTVVFGINPNGSAKVYAARVVGLTPQRKFEAATHRNTRKMVAELGVSATSGSRHWRKNGFKPHLVRGFKIFRDSKVVEKAKDVVGLQMSLPEHAIVMCCDEKSRVQALNRTQRRLLLKKGCASKVLR
ncbi:MAG: hypothetical protein ACLQHK_02890 [Gallionellaceae bacterium]